MENKKEIIDYIKHLAKDEAFFATYICTKKIELVNAINYEKLYKNDYEYTEIVKKIGDVSDELYNHDLEIKKLINSINLDNFDQISNQILFEIKSKDKKLKKIFKLLTFIISNTEQGRKTLIEYCYSGLNELEHGSYYIVKLRNILREAIAA